MSLMKLSAAAAAVRIVQVETVRRAAADRETPRRMKVDHSIVPAVRVLTGRVSVVVLVQIPTVVPVVVVPEDLVVMQLVVW